MGRELLHPESDALNGPALLGISFALVKQNLASAVSTGHAVLADHPDAPNLERMVKFHEDLLDQVDNFEQDMQDLMGGDAN